MRIFNYENKRVEEISDDMQADELIRSGQAVELDIPMLTSYENKADEIHTNYKKEVERIKNSDNPLLQSPEVRKYELDRLEQEYRAQSAEVEAEYKEWRAAQIEESKVRAAQATIKVSDNDKLVAEQFKNRASLKLAAAVEKGDALTEIKNEISLLTDGQRVALQGEIAGLIGGIEGNATHKQAIISAVQDIRNSDLLAVKVAEQLPHSVLTMQRVEDIAKRVAREPGAMRDGGIDREFYEEHLKGKGAFKA
ncbi:hypothetical protein J8TS2_24100 [Lederbergia ruris]|uniref:Uncharacterized protein n=1 Tax=Lederbergia ruris TaxID=217495 RepID=A0ABQ4KKW5_9BACI|nr:hypothetical protein [Lederbergia ruris]GIN58091.1 hypothetical protein J8TS2_24100 [Lederbergia ruris]